MSVILDTGIFYRPRLLEETLDLDAPVVLPTVVVAERKRQLERDQRALDLLEWAVRESGFVVASFGLEEAMSTPALDDVRWKRHARDAMIASHVRPGDVLWTANPKDFLALGLAPEQIRAI